MLIRRLGLVLVLWLCGLSAALAEKRVALLIAADDYRNIRPLENPSNDARALEAVLEQLDFQVYVETNRDLKRTRRALEDFQEDAAGADVALLFFAGHGVAIDGVNYLLPTDADASSAARLAETSLPLSEAQEAIQSVARIAIILLDACRDDPFAGGGTEGRGAAALEDDPPTAPKPKPGLGRIGRADGVLFAFAAAPGETASDGDGQNSPFTSALVRHFATAGVELRTALTLVQQDVYDRSRGKQLPYIESGLPELIFISGQGVLPERDQLLIAMANLTPDIRAEVEYLATARNLPLAPLYAALLSADLDAQTPEERAAMLIEAAQSYESFQSELQKFQSDDPRVAALRAQAEEQLTLGAFDAARGLLTDAAEIDATARTTIKATYLSRTLSEAATHMLNANAARTDLRYDLAISDLQKAATLYAEVAGDIDREAQFAYVATLTSLGELHLVAGNTEAAWSAYNTRATFAQARVEADATDVEWVRELVWSLNDLGGVLQQQGYLKEAETAYSSALEFSEWQADQRPDDVDLMRDRQVAVNRVGSIRLTRRNAAGALDAHVEALGIAHTLLDSDPTNITYRMDISYTQERIGDAKLDLGDKEGAKAAFQTALAIAEALVTEYPTDTVIRRNLSVSYERIGDMLVDEGDYPAALETYGKALAIREELAALDPGNKPRQRDLAINFDRIGDAQRFIGDTDSALLAHQAALSIRQNLAALDPTNMVWQQDLLVSLDRMGDLHFDGNDFVAALEAQETARSIAEGIVALNPDEPIRQADLGLALQKIADIKTAMGDTTGAREVLQSALTLRLALADADPAPRFQRDAALTLTAMAEMDLAAGDPAAAEPLIADAVARQTLMAGAAPADSLVLRDLSIAQNIHASTLMQLGRNSEAVTVAMASLETADRLLQLGPDVPDHMHDRLVTLNRLGDAQVALGDNRAAVESFLAMVDQGNQLLDIDPYSTGWANDLALALERLGTAQSTTGDVAAALKSHQDSLALRDWLVSQDPSNALWYRNLALSRASVATALSDREDFDTALTHQEESLRIMRDLAAAYPDDPWYRIDLVRALDQTAVLLQDPTAENQEALAILEEMQAAGTLPQGYEDWIAGFRKALGLPTEF
ncbi:caspase family protein [Tabrizicola sp.]|uniref:caspase family protein n=1 Tax=Tabrizicola sp. TaxID=2005166 RepID=UPI0025EAF725|nr:caspase family protein [Tabrizicola sp.]